MKKSIFIIAIIVLIIPMVSCNKNQIKNNENKANIENNETNYIKPEEKVLTKEDIKSLSEEGNDTMFITKKGEDIVSGKIHINSEFNGELTILSSKEKEKILSLYIDNKQVKFELEGKNSIFHKVNLKKGENRFNIKINKEVTNKINSCVMILSNNNVESEIVPILYIPFNIINDDISVENRKESLKKEDKISYKNINNNEINEDGTSFEYFNLSINDYLNQNYNNISYEIKSNIKENIEIPMILSAKSVNKGANIKVILNGIEVYSKILNEDLKNTIYVPLKFKAPKEKGNYVMNIMIFDQYYNNTTVIRSNDFKLEVK